MSSSWSAARLTCVSIARNIARMKHAMQTRATRTQIRRAPFAATAPRLMHSLADLQMALEDKARGQRIAQLRKRTRGLTQQQVALDLKVGYRTVQSWESGAVVPEWPNIEAMAKYFKVRPEEILGDMPPMEPAQLDRIEEMLGVLLDHFGLSRSERVDHARGAVRAAKRAKEQAQARDREAPAKAPPKKKPGRAA